MSQIDPQAVIEDGAEIGPDCRIAAFAVIKRGARLKAGVTVDHFAVVGGAPQDLGFDESIESGVVIGEGSTLREGVTVHRSTQPGEFTQVGPEAFLMAYSHVGHDTKVGEKAILANSVLLAGHVDIGSHSFIGGGAAFHQFVRVGEGAMVSGNARIAQDVPPFTIAHERNLVSGLNLIGLRRRGFSAEVVRELKHFYHELLMQPGQNLAKAAAALQAESKEAQRFLDFFQFGKRGFVRHAAK